MSGAEDTYRLGVEYVGGDAIKRFAADMSLLPEDLVRAVSALEQAGAPKAVMSRLGSEAGRMFVAAFKMATGNMLPTGALGVQGNIGSAFTQSLGINPRNTRQIADMETAANRVYQQQLNAQRQSANLGRQAYSEMRSGVDQYVRSLQSATIQVARLGQEQGKLSQVPTTLQRDLDAAQRVAVTPQTRDMVARAAAASQPIAATYAPVVREQMVAASPSHATLEAVAASDARWVQIQARLSAASEAVRLANANAVAWRQASLEQSMVRMFAGGASDAQVAARSGLGTASEAGDFRKALEGQIDAAKVEAAAAKDLAEAQKLAATDVRRQQESRASSFLAPRDVREQGYVTDAAQAERAAYTQAQRLAATQERAYASYASNLPAALAQEHAYGSYASNMSAAVKAAQDYAYGSYASNVVAGRRGALGGFADQFMSGFTAGGTQGAFGEMVGQTARISMFYGTAYRVLSGLQMALQNAVTETVAYENALTNLNLVTGRTREENTGLASTLSDIATAAGFTPSTGVDLGSKALGLYGVAQSDAGTQRRVIELSATVATQMARVSGGEPAATQTQLAGALRSLGWGIERLPELQDTITYLSRQTGQAPSELLGAFANVQTLAAQGGFTPQQTAALLAQVATTTGQNPESTAGQFRQLFSRTASEIATQATPIVGANLQGMDLQQIFDTVSKLNLSADQLNRFASLFGKGGSQQVATILTQQYQPVQGLAAGAQAAQGYGLDAYNRVMTSFGNQAKELGAELVQLGVQLVETGIVDWMALLVEATKQVVEVGTDMLRVLDLIPRPMRSVALALGEVYAAALLAQRTGLIYAGSQTGGTMGLAGRVAGSVLAAPGAAAGWARTFLGAGSSAEQGAMLASLGRGIGASVRGALVLPQGQAATGILSRVPGLGGLTTLGQVGLVGLAAYGVGSGVAGYNANQANMEALQGARGAALNATSVESLREASAQAANAAAQIRSGMLGGLQVGDVEHLLTALINQATQRGNLTQAEQMSGWASQRADSLQKVRDTAATSTDKFFGGDYSAEGLASGIKAMSDAGYSARQQLDLLNQTFDRLAAGATAVKGAVAVLSPGQVGYASHLIGQAGLNAVQQSQDYAMTARYANLPIANPGNLNPIGTFKNLGKSESFERAANAMKNVDTSDMSNALTDYAYKYLTAAMEDGALSDSELKGILAGASNLATQYVPNFNDLNPQFQAEFKASIAASVRQTLQQFSPEKIAQDPAAYWDVATKATEEVAAEQQARGTGQTGILSGKLQQLQANYGRLSAAVGQGDFTQEDVAALRQADTDIRAAKNALTQSRMNDIDALLQFQTAGLRSDDTTGRLKAEAAALAAKFALGPSSTLTPSGGSAEAIAGALGDQSRWTGIQGQQAQNAEQDRQNQLAIARARIGAGVDPRNTVGAAGAALAQAQVDLGGATRGEASYYAAQQAVLQARVQYVQAQVAVANAAAEADVAGQRSQIVQAQVAIATAQRNLAVQIAGTEGYYQALASLRQAQADLATANLDQVDRLARLSSDLTDPVTQARLDVLKQRRQLTADQSSGQGADVLAQDQVDLKGGQNTLEAAQFNQRLQDIQTAQDLGRITQSAYMSYLQSEHDRLSAIADRTRQQQDELDQVDKLMKSAADQINGQFNLGQIDLPTVYEVRRSIASGSPSQVADYSNSHNVVNVNGADFDQVVAWLAQYLGANAQVVRSAPRR